ncbi:PEP-CTERM sorting domain-containing protein [Coleofasciculus chthonoplastes]|uniref:PEP-CTERM sorting domain-containing protein n=1 Tax=Coleofasciculus chthonoplastes TaxID=64178 RepID=UPI003304CDC9
MFTSTAMKTLSMTAASATLMALGTGVTPAEAVTVFTDRTAWEETVSNITTETFSTPQNQSENLLLESGIQVTGMSSVWSSGQFDTSTPSRSESVEFEFPSQILGFGADFSSTTSNGGLTVSGLFDEIPGVDTVVFSEYLQRQGTGFLGIVADTAFNSLSFAMQSPPLAVSAANEAFQMDNFSFASNLADRDAVSFPESLTDSETENNRGEPMPLLTDTRSDDTRSESVPEPTSVLGLLITAVLGTTSILKRQTR